MKAKRHPFGRTKMRPVHPGEVLQEQLDALGLSATSFAEKLRVPRSRIVAILRGTRRLKADTALRLERVLGTSATFWVNLQIGYDLRCAELNQNPEIGRLRRLRRPEQ
jgi:addiction module HigA family antidote